jgi:hypothetical protein
VYSPGAATDSSADEQFHADMQKTIARSRTGARHDDSSPDSEAAPSQVAPEAATRGDVQNLPAIAGVVDPANPSADPPKSVVPFAPRGRRPCPRDTRSRRSLRREGQEH